MRAFVTATAVLLSIAAFSVKAGDDSGTGAFFDRYCGSDGKPATCNVYMFAYTQGLLDGIKRSDEAANDFQQRCQKGTAVFCHAPPSSKVNMEYFGCHKEASKLPLASIQQLILISLQKHPERKDWDFGSVYRAAIDETFGCSAQAEP